MTVTVGKLKEPEQKHRIMEMTRIADLYIHDLDGREEKLTIEKLPLDTCRMK